ncbi:hypothetical protein SCHPADRAFT_452177 [Schizopora paradoxa]|uniref:Uncharacterized protein n=1 Tax=Schizopora paradoxa TaxID=27342 RepID=A0A0H2RIK7_9AGAM|nr:hypothetical protein SCHPADRAFT_452177 [Schizopora paradoxa]
MVEQQARSGRATALSIRPRFEKEFGSERARTTSRLDDKPIVYRYGGVMSSEERLLAFEPLNPCCYHAGRHVGQSGQAGAVVRGYSFLSFHPLVLVLRKTVKMPPKTCVLYSLLRLLRLKDRSRTSIGVAATNRHASGLQYFRKRLMAIKEERERDGSLRACQEHDTMVERTAPLKNLNTPQTRSTSTGLR